MRDAAALGQPGEDAWGEAVEVQCVSAQDLKGTKAARPELCCPPESHAKSEPGPEISDLSTLRASVLVLSSEPHGRTILSEGAGLF